MLGQSFYFRGEREQLSQEEQKAGSRMFWSVVAFFALLAVIFVAGQAFKVWSAGRALAIDEMKVERQFVFAGGDIQRLIPTQEAVFFVDSGGAVRRMSRTLPGWQTVRPEPVAEAGETLLGVSPEQPVGLAVRGRQWYLKDLATGAVTALPELETGKGAPRRAIVAPGSSSVIVEVEETSGGTALWLCLLPAGENWEYLTDGAHASFDYDGKTLYFEREGSVFSRDMKSGAEKQLAEGRLPSMADAGSYLAYVGQHADGGEAVFVCRPDRPEKAYCLTESSGASYRELIWEKKKTALYVAKETEDGVQVKYYELADIKPDVTQQTGDWMEAWLLGDAETTGTIFPRTDYLEDLERFRLYGVGFHADPKNNGLESGGMYQKLLAQLWMPEEEWPCENWDGKLYYDTGRDGYVLDGFLTRAVNFCRLEDGRAYLQNADGSRSVVGGEVFSHAALCAYNPGHDDVTVVWEQDGVWRATSINDGGKREEIELELPENAVPRCISFSQKGHVAVLQYEAGQKPGAAVLNLRNDTQLTAEFLQAACKIFWRTEQLIVHSGDEQLWVRWVYTPGDGLLTLHEPEE